MGLLPEEQDSGHPSLVALDDVEDYARVLRTGGVFVWSDGNGDPNPVVGDTLAKAFFYQQDSGAVSSMKLG